MCSAHLRLPRTCQVIDHKILNGGGQGGQTRHRLVISDGQAFMQAMLATQLNSVVDSGQVRTKPRVSLSTWTSA